MPLCIDYTVEVVVFEMSTPAHEYSVHYNSLKAQCRGGVKKSGAFDNISVKVVLAASLSIHGMLTKVVRWCWMCVRQ